MLSRTFSIRAICQRVIALAIMDLLMFWELPMCGRGFVDWICEQKMQSEVKRSDASDAK